VQHADEHGGNLVGRNGRLADAPKHWNDDEVFRRSRDPALTLEDVLELPHGIGLTVMRISAWLDEVYAILEGEDDEDS
jgi:hypothetical protein